MYRVSVQSPFIEGINTDTPAHLLRPRECVLSQDIVAPYGVAQIRRGWLFDGTTADVASNLQGVNRQKFILADATYTVTTAANGNIYRHNSASAGTLLYDAVGTWLPRAMYRDELIFCNQDGVTPLQRWSGGITVGVASDALSGSLDAGEGALTDLSFSTQPDPGTYITSPFTVGYGIRILSSTTTTVTPEDLRNVGGELSNMTTSYQRLSATIQCVSIYSAGSTTVSASTATGLGTKWVDDAGVTVNDAIIRLGTGTDYVKGVIDAVTNNTTLTTNFGTISNPEPHDIARSCPFKDVAVHQDSLWGTGVSQYPNRVYVSPPGWNPSISPGFVAPVGHFESGVRATESRNDYFLDFVDVPSPYEGDVNIALVSTTNPCLVLKRHNCYGIFGNFPVFTTNIIAEGAGCIDIRSAQELPAGSFWAGENGIFTYQNGRVIDITKGRINRAWRNAMRNFDPSTDTVAIGQVKDHLIVSHRESSASVSDWVFDLNAGVWITKFTNHSANYYFTSTVPDEFEEMYWVDEDEHQGRVMKSSGCFQSPTDVPVSSERDGDGDKPQLLVYSGSNVSSKGPEKETTCLDIATTAVVYDGGAAGSTVLSGSVDTYDALAGTSSTKPIDSINSVNTLPSFPLSGSHFIPARKYTRHINNRGRVHQVKLNVGTYDTDGHASGATVEIHQLDLSFMDTADRT